MARHSQGLVLWQTCLLLVIVFICSTVVYFSGKETKYSKVYNRAEFTHADKMTVLQSRTAISKLNHQVHYNSTLFDHGDKMNVLQSRMATEKSNHQVHYNSTLFDVEELPPGPILRVRHLVEGSSTLSTCQAFGEGLHRAEVGIIATVTIKLDQTRIQDFNKKVYFSVLAVGENHIFVADISSLTTGDLHVNFTYTPTLPGEYDLYVEEIAHSDPWQKQVPGSPFRLVVSGSKVSNDDLVAHADSLSSCQTIPQKDLSWMEGSWITRKLAGRKHGVLRSGWVFQPKRCSFDIFTVDDIAIAASSTTPKSIAILGSSMDRGIFLSLVDLLLTDVEKKLFKDSDLSRCWGYMEVQLGNLKVIYKDFRIQHSSKSHVLNEKSLKIVCHDEMKFTNSYDFFDDALGFLRDFLFSDGLWPDAISVTIGGDPQLRLLMSAIPDSWRGVIYPLNSLKSGWTRLYTSRGREEDIAIMKQFATVDSRVRVLDGFLLGSGMRHATQSSPFIMKANHWHTFCEELNGDMRVCGITTEMVAQILLAQVLAPDGKEAWTREVSGQRTMTLNKNVPRKLAVCYDCPLTLSPFHIKRKPDLKCYRSNEGLRLHSQKDYPVWNGTICPTECMLTTPVKQLTENSQSVDVRECMISV